MENLDAFDAAYADAYGVEYVRPEEWRAVVGSEGKYEVSNAGRIRNKFGRIFSPAKHRLGYLWVRLTHAPNETKCYYVHRLVAQAFVPNPTGRPEVNHKDLNKTNNRFWNLEWASRAENMQHSFDNQVVNTNNPKGEASPCAKLTWAQVCEIRDASGFQQDIADRYGVSRRLVGMIRAGQKRIDA